MGRGRTLARAVAELKALPRDNFERCTALPILIQFRIEASKEPVSPADEEFLMTTQEIVKMFEQEAEQRGELRGEQRGELRGERRALERQRNMVLRLLRQKFGELPSSVITRVHVADVNALERFADKLLFANTAEDIIADEP